MERKEQRQEMRKKLLSNWGIKLISLLVAFSLWFVVVYFEDPPEQQIFVDIPVRFVNTDILTDEGLVYEVLDDTDVVERVTVRGPKTVLSDMRSAGNSSIVATADFADKNMSDEIDIQFEVVTQYKSAITDIIPATGSEKLRLFVEEKKNKSVPIRTIVQGEVAEGHQIGVYTTEQTRLTVTGGESKVDQVSYAAVTIDVSGNDMDISTIETIRLYDKDGKLLDNNLVQKNISTTKANVSILGLKTVPVVYQVTGEPAEGYRLTGEVRHNVEAITIAAQDPLLNTVNAITIPDIVFDVSGMTEDLEKEINLRNYLPSGVIFASEEENTALTVKVGIQPEIERTYKVLSNNISIQNVPEGFTAYVEQEYSVYDLNVLGLEKDLSDIVESQLSGTVDVAAWMEEIELTELIPSHYYIPMDITLPDGVEQMAPVEVRVTFEAAE